MFISREDRNEVADWTQLIGTLGSSNKVTLLTSDEKSQIPSGCATVTVSAKCTVSIALKVDFSLKFALPILGYYRCG